MPLTITHDPCILSMVTVMLAPGPGRAEAQGCFIASAAKVVQKDGPWALPKKGAPRGSQCPTTAQRTADHGSIPQVPGVITHSPPVPSVPHLQPPGTTMGAISQAQSWGWTCVGQPERSLQWQARGWSLTPNSQPDLRPTRGQSSFRSHHRISHDLAVTLPRPSSWDPGSRLTLVWGTAPCEGFLWSRGCAGVGSWGDTSQVGRVQACSLDSWCPPVWGICLFPHKGAQNHHAESPVCGDGQ